jgi:hypothetical protein
MHLSVFKNSKIVILAVFSAITVSHSSAQEKPTVAKSQFKINVLLPGFVYEHGLSSKNTLYSEISSGYGYTSNTFGYTSRFYPFINTQIRHYYNLDKRVSKNKTIKKNTGSFVAFEASYHFKSINTNKNFLQSDASLIAGPVWGFQRTYNKNFNLDLNAGIAYNFKKADSNVIPIINFTLGWVIGK